MKAKNNYGVFINTTESKVELIEFDGKIGWQHIASTISSELIELARITSGVDLFVDEEGLINGGIERIGLFRIQDADGVNLGQGLYVGNGLILKNSKTRWGENSVGFSKGEATRLLDSLIVSMWTPEEIAAHSNI